MGGITFLFLVNRIIHKLANMQIVTLGMSRDCNWRLYILLGPVLFFGKWIFYLVFSSLSIFTNFNQSFNKIQSLLIFNNLYQFCSILTNVYNFFLSFPSLEKVFLVGFINFSQYFSILINIFEIIEIILAITSRFQFYTFSNPYLPDDAFPTSIWFVQQSASLCCFNLVPENPVISLLSYVECYSSNRNSKGIYMTTMFALEVFPL